MLKETQSVLIEKIKSGPNHKRLVIIVAALFITIVAAVFYLRNYQYDDRSTTTININATQSHKYKETSIGYDKLKLINATQSQEQRKGLCCIDYISDDSGMLFSFKESGSHGIWMKDMRFAIDIIWLNKSKKIINIEKNVQPSSYPRVYGSSYDSKYVIELKSGYVDKHNVTINTDVSI